jgi:dihydropteroate synthase
MGRMSLPADEREAGFATRAWVHGDGVLSLERPRVMAIVNLTPDSFSDGGTLVQGDRVDVEAAALRCAQLVREGADLLDLGGESTRPGAAPVDPEVERARVVPVLRAIAELGVPRSVDTRRASVARAAIEAGAAIVNDVSGLADPDMAAVVADSDAGLVIGHLRGVPATMQREVRFVDLLREITDELATAVERAVAAGVERPRIVVDPGIGFGKTAEQSAALVAAAGWLRQATRCPVLVGASRKSFLSAIVGGGPHDRLPGSLAAALVAVERGASVLRVHDVVETVHALAVARSIRAAYDAAEARARSGGDLH